MTTPLYVELDPTEFQPKPRYLSAADLAMPRVKAEVCQHARADFGKPSGGMVDVVCLDCGHTWRQVKVIGVKP